MRGQEINGFEAALKRAALEFKRASSSKCVKLVSNLDSDGIAAASIMIRALERLSVDYSLTILHQLRENDTKALADEDYEIFVFCDLGSGQLKHINRYMKDRSVFILDHHEVQGKPKNNVCQINPHDYGFEGSTEISAAGVCFFFARELDNKNDDLAHLAVIGAIGDVQEKNGFIGLNRGIVDAAVANGSIRIEQGLKLFGLETRTLDKLLIYSGDLSIRGVSNNDCGARKFLKELGLSAFRKNRPCTFYDLSDDEKQKLVEGIIEKRKKAGLKDAENVFTNIYLLSGEEHGHFRDAKEFSTLLNSCGRMDNATLGIGACLNDAKLRKEAERSLVEYKREIINSMNWYHKHIREESSRITKGHNYIIINAKDDIMATMIGTLASMISKKGDFEKNIFVMSMARSDDDTTKVSLRVSGNPENVDLKDIMAELSGKVGGEAGGHQFAAGAVIRSDKEDEFIEQARALFELQHKDH